MGELEDKLNSILSSPDEMEKIMNIARSISGSVGSGGSESGSAKGANALDLSSISSALGNIDPKIFNLVSRLLGEYGSGSSDKAVLLNAMKPYLKSERHEKIDKALELARLAKIARIAFSEFSGGDLGV